MKITQSRLVIIVSVVTLISIVFGTVVATALSQGNFSSLHSNVAVNGSNETKYEKPSVGDIAQDGAYPDEIESSSSAHAQEKEWYEYITYSKKPIEEIQVGNTKLVFYDPYDYNYGMIMEFTNPKSDFGDYYDSEGYTTANEISVSYSTSETTTWAHGWSLDLGFEESLKVGKIGAEVEMKFSQNIGYNGSWTGSNDSSSSKTVTYNALYFNSNGTPYRWRIVKYTVYLPLYCEKQTLKNGDWIVTDTNYCLLATVQGTCREWINNVAYVEDWRTGEPIQVENFWKEFFSKEALVVAYLTQMLPKN